jgi:hypothetical protein
VLLFAQIEDRTGIEVADGRKLHELDAIYSANPTGRTAGALKCDMDYIVGTELGEVVRVSYLDLL